MTTQLLTVEDVAARLGISVDYTYRLIGRGEIARTKVGRLVRVSESSLAAYIESHTSEPRRARKGTAA